VREGCHAHPRQDRDAADEVDDAWYAGERDGCGRSLTLGAVPCRRGRRRGDLVGRCARERVLTRSGVGDGTGPCADRRHLIATATCGSWSAPSPRSGLWLPRLPSPDPSWSRAPTRRMCRSVPFGSDRRDGAQHNGVSAVLGSGGSARRAVITAQGHRRQVVAHPSVPADRRGKAGAAMAVPDEVLSSGLKSTPRTCSRTLLRLAGWWDLRLFPASWMQTPWTWSE